MNKGLIIGQAADLLHISAVTLRAWEKAGLIPPVRRMNGRWRVYDKETLDKIRFFIKLRRVRKYGEV